MFSSLQQSCFLMSHAIENIAFKSQNIGVMGLDEEGTFDVSLELPKHRVLQSIEIQSLVNASHRAFGVAQDLALRNDLKLIAHEVLFLFEILLDQ